MATANPIQLFRNPRSFFERRLNYPEIKTAGAIILVVCLANWVEVLALWLNIPVPIRKEYIAGLLIFMGINITTPALLWFVYGLWIRFAAGLVGGRTQELRLYTILRFTGWGFIPVILAPIAWGIGRYQYYQDVTFQSYEIGPLITLSMLDQLETTEQMMQQAYNDTTFLALTVLGLLFLLISGYIWTTVVQMVSHDMSRAKAAIIAYLPVLAFIYIKLEPAL